MDAGARCHFHPFAFLFLRPPTQASFAIPLVAATF
jgi:hypothetical protein